MKEFASKGHEVMYASGGNSLKHDALLNSGRASIQGSVRYCTHPELILKSTLFVNSGRASG